MLINSSLLITLAILDLRNFKMERDTTKKAEFRLTDLLKI